MKNAFNVFSLLLLSTGFSHAATISGTYQNSNACSFGNASFLGQVTIPAGKVTVVENVPFASDFVDTSTPSILIQSNGAAQPVLALRIGRHHHFAYGSSDYSMGTYAQDGAFQVEFFPAFRAPAIGQIGLVATDRALELTVSSSTFASPVTCSFARQ